MASVRSEQLASPIRTRPNLDGVYDVCCSTADGNVTSRRRSFSQMRQEPETVESASTVYLTPNDAPEANPPVGAIEQTDSCHPPSYSDVQSIADLGPPPPVPVKLIDTASTL